MKPQPIFCGSIVVTAIVLLVAWHKDPSYDTVPTPGKTVYFSIFGFVMASLLIFSSNVLLAVAKGKNAKSEGRVGGHCCSCYAGTRVR